MKYIINRILLFITIVYSVSVVLFILTMDGRFRRMPLYVDGMSFEQAKKLGVFVHYGQISIWGVIMFLAIFVVLFTLFVITSTSTNDEVAKHRFEKYKLE